MAEVTQYIMKIAAIIVTYNAKLAITAQQLRLLKDTCYTILVDNGSSESTISKLESLVQISSNSTLIKLNNNQGIAKAQNIGAQFAIQIADSPKYLLFLDHDSLPCTKMIEKLLHCSTTLEDQGLKIGAIGPKLVENRTHITIGFHAIRLIPHRVLPSTDATFECATINSSGSFIPVSSWLDVGPNDESLFIDHVETEWCFKAKKKGYKLFACPKAILFHEMGDEVINYWLFKKREMPYRTPKRHYYIFRNSIALQKRDYVSTNWKFFNLIKLGLTLTYFGLFSHDRMTQLRYMLKGISDGIKGKSGQNNIS